MKAICPNKCTDNEFITVAHMSEYWLVDEAGDFIEVVEPGECLQGPMVGNTWVCNVCGAEAEVTDE